MDEETCRAVEAWEKEHNFIPDCRIGAKITVKACLLRQKSLPHWFRQFVGDGWVTHRAVEFVSCAGCPHYHGREHDSEENKRIRGAWTKRED